MSFANCNPSYFEIKFGAKLIFYLAILAFIISGVALAMRQNVYFNEMAFTILGTSMH
jgi:hypothetical protein